MKQPITFSIIIPAFNAQSTITACVESLLQLNWSTEDRELIFVDNNSTDDTRNILNRYAPKIRLFDESRKGASAARNRGLQEAKGLFIVFLDADCIADPNLLDSLKPHLEQHNVGIVGGAILSKRPCNRVEKFGERVHDQQKAIELFKPPYVDSANWASPINILLEQKGFDEQFLRSQDVDLAWRIVRAGYRLLYAPEAIVYHHNESTWLGLFKEGMVHGKGNIKLREKHADLLSTRPMPKPKYKQIWQAWLQGKYSENRGDALCGLIFNLGKTYGKRVSWVAHQ